MVLVVGLEVTQLSKSNGKYRVSVITLKCSECNTHVTMVTLGWSLVGQDKHISYLTTYMYSVGLCTGVFGIIYTIVAINRQS